MTESARGPRSSQAKRSPASGKGQSKASPARVAALEVVRLQRERDGFVQDIMTHTVDLSPLSPEDRAFAARLSFGVVSCAGTLNEALDSCLDSPKDVRPKVRDALLISTYEMLFLGKSPYAAVDQGVELVRAVAPRAAGLANAVLRRVVRLRDDFPFGDPTRDLSAFARSQGFPTWLAEKLVERLGEDDARAFMGASNEPAPLFVAVNAIKATDEEAFALLEGAAAGPERVEVDGRSVEGCFRLSDRRALLEPSIAGALEDGRLLVADAASQTVAAAVAQAACGVLEEREAEQEPFSLLEVGAGRATKTILLQSDAVRFCGKRWADHITIDNVGFKSELLRQRTEVYGASVSEAIVGDATDLAGSLGERRFDLIFIDSPCTGLGTLRRHPEIRWRIRPESIEHAAELDLRLLRSAAVRSKPRGVLAYATCTVTHEENEGAIARFLDLPEGSGFTIERTLRTDLVPGGASPDAHFLCILRRA